MKICDSSVSDNSMVRGKDIVKGVDYYLTFDFYGYGNTKVRLVKFTKRGNTKVVILKSDDGKLFELSVNGKIFKEPFVLVKQGDCDE